MWMLIAPFLVGLLVGWRTSLTPRLGRLLDSAVLATLFLLLLVMGARLGSDPRVTAQLREMGVQAITIAALAITGSILVVRLAIRGWLRELG